MPEIAPGTTAPATQPRQDAPDETARYMGGLETHLASLPPARRLPRLLELKTWWIAEFDRWAMRVDQGVATVTDLQCRASDFRMTIDAVSARAAEEERKAAVIPTEPNDVPDHAADGWAPGSPGIVP